MTDVNRQIVLRERPLAAVGDEHFELRTGPVPVPGPGEILVRVLWLSFDPTQRGWLNDVPSYLPPVQIGEVMRAGAVGQVVASNREDFAVGDLVQGTFGWQDYVATDGRGMRRVTKIPVGVPPQAMLGVFGVTGLTAYFGMLDVARVGEGDVVFVSGAAGATGSVAGQIAKLKGARVIGSAGGAEKCTWVRDVAGFDDVIDYRSEDTAGRLRAFAPEGLTVYFDNVGGPTLEAALANLAIGARIALCGGISSGYMAEALPPGPRNYMELVIKRATMTGFLVIDYIPRFGEGVAQLAQWVQEGRLRYAEDVVEGLEHAPATLNRLFEGKNLGKQLLKVADPPIG